MLDPIRYRGPDDWGIHLDRSLGLGHVRLSIQDLSPLAAQPIVSHDRRHVIAYNGEIYNVRELQTRLRQEGIQLLSTGDTEALLEYLSRFGIEKTLDVIEGMFAFVLWDKQEQTVTMARDRHGIKPLYYRLGPRGEVRFASEMKVLAHPEYEPDLCTLSATLMGLGGTWGEPSVFRQVRHICPGEWVVFSGQKPMQRRHFFHIHDFVDEQLSAELGRLGKMEVVERVHEELRLSTEGCLISDAPVAAFASGGIDSSLIVALARAGYPNLKLYHANVVTESETHAAESLAKTLGLELCTATVTDADVLANMPVATYHYEAPLAYHFGSCVPFYMVSRLAGQDGIKVVLTGEGSDEYFLGYPMCAVRPILLKYQRMMRVFQNLVHTWPSLGKLLWPRHEDSPAEQLRRLVFRYELEERRTEADNRLHFIRNATERDLRVLAVDMVIGNVTTLLQRNDRLAMAWGLESRFPFLGSNVARVAVNLPTRYKVRKVMRAFDWRHAFICDKWVVRAVAERYLPPSLTRRKKFGFQSSVDRRLTIQREFFQGGFLEAYFGLNQKAFGHMLDGASGDWLGNVFSLEIWGLVFTMRRPFEAIQEQIARHVTLRAKPA